MHSSVASASVGSATTTTTARTTVETVLRYYYLRGVVHLNCGPKTSFHRAIRCFNTCLTVPTYSNDANVVSAIAVQAWKKLILVQCLQYCEEIGSDSSGCLNADATAATTTAKKPPPQLPASSFSSTNPSYYGSSPASDPMSTTFAATTTTVTTFGGSRNPLATPNDMSAAMSRFLSQSKPPVLSPHSTRLATVETQEPDSHSMHWVEVESNVENPTISNNNNPAPMDMDDDEIDERNSLERRYPSLGAYVYKQLVHAFMEIDRTAFAQLAQEHAALLVEDGNAGLVRRVNTALLHRHVYELSQVYSSVSLSQLAADLGISFSDLSALLVHLQTEKRWPVQWRQDEGSLDGTVELPSSLPVWPSPEDSHAVNQELSALTHMIQIFHVSMVKPTVGRSTSILANPMGGGTPRGVEDF